MLEKWVPVLNNRSDLEEGGRSRSHHGAKRKVLSHRMCMPIRTTLATTNASEVVAKI